MRTFALGVALLAFTAPLPAADPVTTAFSVADRLVDAEQYEPALQAFGKIRSEHPDWVWPRAQRHLEAYTYFRLDQLAPAEGRWGALLCESHTDPLSFRIAYNLALAQERLGETDRAYWTLLLVPGDRVLAQTAYSQQAYFELAGLVASKLKKFSAAAQVYYTASQLLPSASLRARAFGQFKAAAAQIQDFAEWKALAGRTTDPAARAFLEAHRPAEKEGATTAAETGDARIEGLKLAAYRVHEVAIAGAAPTKRLEVLGRYTQSGKTLICGGAPVALDAKGRFKLDLDIVTNTASSFLLALGEGVSPEHQTEEYFAADWSRFQPKIDPDLEASGDASPWQLRQGSLSIDGFFQESGSAKSYFPELSWTPTYTLNGNWRVILEVGLFLSRKILGGNFLGIDDKLMLGYLWRDSVRLAAGGGTQTWVGYGGTHPQASVELGLELGVPVAKILQLQTLLLNGGVLFEPRHTKSFSLGLQFGF